MTQEPSKIETPDSLSREMFQQNDLIHSVYLPFSREQLLPHFNNPKHLDYFATSATRYSGVSNGPANTAVNREVRLQRQIEKDERFWTACTLKSVFDAGRFEHILRLAFGDSPPLMMFGSWQDCVGEKGDQELKFEVAVSSPLAYRESLRSHFVAKGATAHLVPYIVDAAKRRTLYEGTTKVDAVFVNRRTGFSVMFEAKVLSDVSCDVVFDPCRNQLARNIDVMLDDHKGFLTPEPSKRLFALLTPQMFKVKPSTRYYGFLFNEYKRNSTMIAEHLPHREANSLSGVPARLGWLTFEECMEVCPGCCPWLEPQTGGP